MSITPDLLHEYQLLLTGGGYVDLSDRTKLELRGRDRTALLHKFCTNDIKRLLPGEGCEAFVCNAKGHILSHVNVLCGDDVLRLDCVPGQGATLADHLDRYVIREDVQIIDCTHQYKAVLTVGEPPSVLAGLPAFRLDVAPRASLTWLPAETAFPASLKPRSREALEIVRIEHGFPWFGIDFSDGNLPQEIGRDEKTLSFTKGCYLGQETVARLASLGHVNQSLCSVVFGGDSVPPAGLELTGGGKVVGHVTSACWSPQHGQPLALAFVRRGHSTSGSLLESALGEGRVIASPASSR